MSNTLLQLGQAIAIKAGLPLPTTIIGNTDRTVQAIFQAIKDGTHKDVFRDADWSFLQAEYQFQTTGAKYYALPDYFDRIINNTIWDRTNDQVLIGPVGPEKWQMYYSGMGVTTGSQRICRLIGPSRRVIIPSPDPTADEAIVEADNPIPGASKPLRRIQIHPDVSSTVAVNTAEDPILIAFEYIINQYIVSSKVYTTYQSEWTDDGDICMFDDDVVEAAALWRLLRILGMSYADEREEYNALVAERGSHDGGAETLNLLQSDAMFNLNIPDTGFGS